LDLSGFPSPSWITDAAGNVIRPKIQTALVTVPGNGKGGYFRGVEFAVKAPFELLLPSLEGFGMDFNISLNESSVPTPDRNIGFGQIDSLSKRVVNLAVYYEKNGFQARVNGSNRSRFLQPIVNYASQVEYRIAEPATYVDAQLGYTFQSESALDGLSVILQARNITNQAYVTNFFKPYSALNYDDYGSTYELSVTYKF
jgi:iron complex outermembrane recepter protein